MEWSRARFLSADEAGAIKQAHRYISTGAKKQQQNKRRSKVILPTEKIVGVREQKRNH